MARRKQVDDGGGGGGDWLNTYADMVTLLLTFFILLFSMSTLDSTKFNLMVKALSNSVDDETIIIIGKPGPNDMDTATPEGPDEMQDVEIDLQAVFEQIQKQIQEQGQQDSVNAVMGDGYIFIQFMDNMLFEPNSARLKPADLEILNFVGMSIKSVQSQLEVVRIDGHTAAIPENPDYPVSDRELSSDRANSVLIYFEDSIGINGTLLRQVGFGKWKPLPGNTNSTPEERSKNRRVEILISTKNQIDEELDNIYDKLVE